MLRCNTGSEQDVLVWVCVFVPMCEKLACISRPVCRRAGLCIYVAAGAGFLSQPDILCLSSGAFVVIWGVRGVTSPQNKCLFHCSVSEGEAEVCLLGISSMVYTFQDGLRPSVTDCQLFNNFLIVYIYFSLLMVFRFTNESFSFYVNERWDSQRPWCIHLPPWVYRLPEHSKK